MFGPFPFPRGGPFARLPIPSSFAYANYMTHLPSPHMHESHHRDHHIPQPHRRRHHPHRRHSNFNDDTGFTSSDEMTEDAYYISDDVTPLRNLHARREQRPYSSDYDSGLGEFSRVSVKLPSRTADTLGRNEILILPRHLTRLRVQIRTTHGSETLHATVAGDMSLRDVVKQLLPQNHDGAVRASVKLRGSWVEPGSLVRLSELVEQGRFVMTEEGEVEVRLEIGGGLREDLRGDGGRMKETGWQREREMEVGRAWEIRT